MAAEAMGEETHSVLSPDALDLIGIDSFGNRFAVEFNTPVLGCVMEMVDPLPCNFHTASLDCSPDMEGAREGAAIAKEVEIQKELVGSSLGRGGHALDNFQFRVKAKVEKLLAGGEKALLRDACDVLIQEAQAVSEILLLERGELAAEACCRRDDAAAHVELICLKHQHILEAYEIMQQERTEIQKENKTAKRRVLQLETQNRELQSRLQTMSGQLKNAEAALKERAHACAALKFPDEEKKLTGDLVEFAEMYLIDDLCEELLEHVASEAHTEAQLAAEVKCLSERVSKLQDFGITSERRELEMKQRINDLEGDLANEKNAVARLAEENENLIKDKDKLVKEKEKIAQENEDSDKMRKSELMLSPRSTDAQVLRARFREAHDALRSKDEEIDELHKLLFELRPKLEREVEGQVKGIMEQAEHDAGRIRLEAQRLRDAHANRVDWQDQEIEQCRREIQVLSAAALHRDELIEKLRQVECEKEELAKRLDALVGEPQGETDTRDAPVLLASIAWRLAAIMAIVAASLALLSCSSGLPPRRAVPSASAEASCRGKFWWWAGAEQSTSAASSASDVSLGSARDSGFCRTLTSGVSKVFGVLPESQRHLAHAGGLVFMGVAVGATMTILASTLR